MPEMEHSAWLPNCRVLACAFPGLAFTTSTSHRSSEPQCSGNAEKPLRRYLVHFLIPRTGCSKEWRGKDAENALSGTRGEAVRLPGDLHRAFSGSTSPQTRDRPSESVMSNTHHGVDQSEPLEWKFWGPIVKMHCTLRSMLGLIHCPIKPD